MSAPLNASKPKKNFFSEKQESWGSFFTFVLIVLIVRSFFLSPFRIPSGSMIPTLRVGDFIITSKMSYGWSSYSMFLGGHLKEYTGFFWGKAFEAMPKRGDVVVFTPPQNNREDYIKRVVGLPGDRVQMIKGELHLNGKKLSTKAVQENFTDYEGGDLESGKKKMGNGTVYEEILPREDGSSCQHLILRQDLEGVSEANNTPEYVVPEDSVFCMGDNRDASTDSRFEVLGPIHKNFLLGRALFFFFSVDHQDIHFWKPWTWIMLPFKIRWSRCGYGKL